VLQKSKAIGRSVKVESSLAPNMYPSEGVTNSPPRYTRHPDAGPSVLGVILGGAMDPVLERDSIAVPEEAM
jgi:hypothetical protein